MVVGVIFRFTIGAVLLGAAYWALRAERVSDMLDDIAEVYEWPRDIFGRPKDILGKLDEGLRGLSQRLLLLMGWLFEVHIVRVRQVMYGFGALWIVFAGTFCYHNTRTLPIPKTLPATTNTQPGYPQQGGQNYGGYNRGYPQGGQYAQPGTAQPAPAQPYPGR